jgi:putative transposase
MPRIARIIAAGSPHHITQRGNNRATVFFDDEDRQSYLNLLLKYTHKYKVSIWAYCLMSNWPCRGQIPVWRGGSA